MRLYLIAGGMVLALLLLLSGMAWRLDAVSDERDRLKAANEANLATIAEIRAAEKRNEEILTELRETRDALTRASESQQRAIRDLAEESADVRAYLAERVPESLAGVLWSDGEDADGSADPAGRADGRLRGERSASGEPDD